MSNLTAMTSVDQSAPAAFDDPNFILTAMAPLMAQFGSTSPGYPQTAAPPNNMPVPGQAPTLSQGASQSWTLPHEDPALERALAGLGRSPAPRSGASTVAPASACQVAQQQPSSGASSGMQGGNTTPWQLDLTRLYCLQPDHALAGLAGFNQLPAAPHAVPPPLHTELAPSASAVAQLRGTCGDRQIAPFQTSAPGYFIGASPSSNEALTSLEVDAIRRDFPILQQKVNGHPLAWLDNAATTQKPRQVMAALDYFYEHDNSNIHRAAHALAARATDAYEGARVKVQRFLKAKSEKEIVFVRGTTEAINLVAQSYGRANLQRGDEVLVTTLEHHANIVPWQMICNELGAVLRPIPITEIGEVDLAAYAQMLSPKTKFVSLAHVSNVLGTIVPVKEMTAMAHAVGARVLVDGAQAVAHLPVNVCDIGCDFYVFSGHKIFGPTGVGALYGRYELLESMPPWQGGGNMIDHVTFVHTTYAPPPAKFEAGTATLADAVGLGAALDYLNSIGLERAANHEQALLGAATSQLSAIPGLRIYGNSAHKAAVVSFLIDGISADTIGKCLDQVGIAVRTGHHCAQPTMQRYGVRNMVRPSFAMYNTFDEVDRLVRAVQRLCCPPRLR